MLSPNVNFSYKINSLYSSVAEHWSCKPGVESSILSGGIIIIFTSYAWLWRWSFLVHFSSLAISILPLYFPLSANIKSEHSKKKFMLTSVSEFQEFLVVYRSGRKRDGKRS